MEIDIEIDVLHPIDPTCMDIHRMKKEFGDKICLAGNVSNEMLQNAEPQVTAINNPRIAAKNGG